MKEYRQGKQISGDLISSIFKMSLLTLEEFIDLILFKAET